ncbi:hypothetical protein V2K69_05490 [Pseudomonas alliivorans]|nr:hypothetical protein [Pseudomonas alliivorans]MEE4715550.1 hypothetical protein [Pseudomonas alliivorans]MEE4720494.1 hypothetical protein [Pseudomonas alliivorans]MEE4755844.1 hypothetical protein [Pseudomonas alliivorans]MEE4761645.1 hypothetical protein [Pseudomonas alliivorans]
MPTSDQRYPELKALETAGASYTRELNELKATGRFEYGYLDSVDDFAARHDELVTRGGAAVSTGINTFIGGSSALGAAVASPACLTGIGCLAPIGLTGLSALSFANAWDSAGTITEPYVSTEGARVISSFNPSNATPENSALAAAGTAAAMSVGEMLLLRGSGKLLLGEYGVGAAGEKVYASDGVVGAKVTSGAVELTFDKANRTWTTPAGLDYGQGSVQGNRVLHVLEHAEPNPAKTTHSVFSMDRKEILGAVDEAWLKKGSPVVGDPGAYVVPMGRAIGTSGETSIKVIVRPGTSQIITAYPVK